MEFLNKPTTTKSIRIFNQLASCPSMSIEKASGSTGNSKQKIKSKGKEAPSLHTHYIRQMFAAADCSDKLQIIMCSLLSLQIYVIYVYIQHAQTHTLT